MSEPLISELAPDALFGVDGTELPEPLAEPSGRGGSGLPPLPSLPNLRITREEIAAELGEEPIGPATQDPEAAPAQRGAAPADALPVDASPIGASSVPVPPDTAPPAAVTAPLSARSAAPTAPAPGRPPRTITPMTAPPAAPTPGKRSGLRYRPPLAVGSRMIGPLDFRRRTGSRGSGVPMGRSNGGATLFFLVALILSVALMYGIVIDIKDSLATLIP